MKARRQNRFRVAVLVETSIGYGRNVCRGIVRFARERGDWAIFHTRGSLGEAWPAWFDRWQGDGVLARVLDPASLPLLRRKAVPYVDLIGTCQLGLKPAIGQDHQAIGTMAADFFLQAGYEHFAFCGFPGTPYSDEREKWFVQRLREQGHDCFRSRQQPSKRVFTFEQTGINDLPLLGKWLAGLPKPLALFACNDARGQQIVMACREAGLRVPEEVAVLGGDNDDVICQLCEPPLSGIQSDGETIGYRGAQMLDQLMRGRGLARESVVVPPLGIVERASTDMIPVKDELVSKALRLIRHEVGRGLAAKELADSLGVSRRILDARLQQRVGGTVSTLIQKERLRRARQMLVEGKLPVVAIARAVGFRTGSHFVRVFRSAEGQTPGAFRERLRRTMG